jgi:hypothetical protein
MNKIEIGEDVEDSITGFSGVLTARCEYLGDSPSLRIESRTQHEGKPVVQWFTESRIVRPS